MKNDSIIFGGSSHPELTKKICEYLNKNGEGDFCGNVLIKNFPDGETYCQYEDNIRGRDVYIIQSTHDPNQNWMELYLLVHTAKLASANKIVVCISYFSYSRQDRKTRPRCPISARLVLDLLVSAGANRVITFDLHSLNTQGFSSVPLDSLLPCNLVIDYFKKNLLKGKKSLKKWILVSPDIGGSKKVEKYGEAMGIDFGMVHKKRVGDEKVIQETLIGDVDGKNVLIIDDMTCSLNTLSGCASLLKKRGAKDIYAFVTHFPLTESGIANLKSEKNIKKILTTNSVPVNINDDKVVVLDASSLFAEAISRTINNKSISSLFEIKGF